MAGNILGQKVLFNEKTGEFSAAVYFGKVTDEIKNRFFSFLEAEGATCDYKINDDSIIVVVDSFMDGLVCCRDLKHLLN